MVAGARDRAFTAFGGTCGRGIHDNMTTAVERVLIGKDRQINPRFAKMCGHCLVDPTFRDPGAAREKGRVESRIMTMRERLFRPRLEGETPDCPGGQMAQRRRRHARGHRHPDFPDRQVHEVSAGEEQRCLAPVREPFRGHASRQVTAPRTCLVRFAGNCCPAMPAGSGGARRSRVTHTIPIPARKPGAIRGWRAVPGQASAGTAGGGAGAPGDRQGWRRADGVHSPRCTGSRSRGDLRRLCRGAGGRHPQCRPHPRHRRPALPARTGAAGSDTGGAGARRSADRRSRTP